MLTKKNQKEPRFFCKKCDFETSHKPNYERHLLTIKHISVTDANKMLTKRTKKEPNQICSCGREYKHKTSFLRHKKTCVQDNLDDDKIDKIIKQNEEFRVLLLEQSKENKIIQEKMINMKNETHIVNQFNLNFFLNETCKEALSMNDFINSLSIGLNDLEYVGRNGYVEGIANIFLNGLRKLDVSKRPIHCSDLKREVLYIKDEKWEKDDEKIKITKAIKNIAQLNIRQIPQWANENPAHDDIRSNKNTDYLNIIKESVSYDEEKNNKIIKILSKETIIEKR